MAVPPRITRALSLLQAKAGERVLEIGSGAGVGLQALLSSRAQLTALDRSAIAHERARKRLGTDARRVAFVEGELAAYAPAEPFHAVIAIDVNAFWTDADASARALSHLVASGGRVVLVFAPPAGSSAQRCADIAARVTTGLGDVGFRVVVSTTNEGLVAVTATRP